MELLPRNCSADPSSVGKLDNDAKTLTDELGFREEANFGNEKWDSKSLKVVGRREVEVEGNSVFQFVGKDGEEERTKKREREELEGARRKGKKLRKEKS